jgi:hypothetical protein
MLWLILRQVKNEYFRNHAITLSCKKPVKIAIDAYQQQLIGQACS